MPYSIYFHQEFEMEFKLLPIDVRQSIFAYIELLKLYGSNLKRPYCDTLKSKKHKNLKELRITSISGEWRVSFAFDPNRNGILLMAASKSGVSQRLFYSTLLKISEKRYELHLENILKGEN
jgi:hypothetical protein